jgi:RNA polymerase sigma-70 factor (ECF subfamily)
VTAVLEPVARPLPDSPHADWALVERAQAGDKEAFAQLYRAHYDLVLRFVRRRVHDTWIAEDITADVFTRALRSLHAVRYAGSPYGAYLVTVARNRVNDHFRRDRWEVPSTRAHDDDLLIELVDETATPEATAESHGLTVAVRAAVARLPAQQRRVVELRFFANVDIAETAAAVGSNANATKALQFRATRALRRTAPELEEWR